VGQKKERFGTLRKSQKLRNSRSHQLPFSSQKLSHSQRQKLTREQDMDLTMQPQTRKILEPCVT